MGRPRWNGNAPLDFAVNPSIKQDSNLVVRLRDAQFGKWASEFTERQNVDLKVRKRPSQHLISSDLEVFKARIDIALIITP